MSDPGGTAAVTNVNLNFDDAAGSSVSCVSGPTSGTYQPTNCADPFGSDTFPAPAPTGPYTTSLAQFNNTDPNGIWNLYVRDDVGGDTGAINGGWSLTLSGSYSLTVTDTLPPGATYGDASGAGWTCTQANGIVTCTRSALALGAAPDIIITAIAPLTPGVITNTATVASGLGDPDASGNTATWVTNVVSETTYGVALAPLAASQSGDPGTVVTYTLTVTNMGNVDDTFTVTLGSNSFSTNAPTDVGPLGAGSSTTFNVVVAIPAGAVEGMTDTVNVTVTSQGNPLMTAGAALTTLVNRRLYLPLITKQ